MGHDRYAPHSKCLQFIPSPVLRFVQLTRPILSTQVSTLLMQLLLLHMGLLQWLKDLKLEKLLWNWLQKQFQDNSDDVEELDLGAAQAFDLMDEIKDDENLRRKIWADF